VHETGGTISLTRMSLFHKGRCLGPVRPRNAARTQAGHTGS
jgi:hypothetical protein